LVDPSVPRTAEVEDNPDASEFVRILGATWLLMDQRTVAETRTGVTSAAGVTTTPLLKNENNNKCRGS
jgi:hypothetical protein